MYIKTDGCNMFYAFIRKGICWFIAFYKTAFAQTLCIFIVYSQVTAFKKHKLYCKRNEEVSGWKTYIKEDREY